METVFNVVIRIYILMSILTSVNYDFIFIGHQWFIICIWAAYYLSNRHRKKIYKIRRLWQWGHTSYLTIPNREVKPTCADGTAMFCGRVGSRLQRIWLINNKNVFR